MQTFAPAPHHDVLVLLVQVAVLLLAARALAELAQRFGQPAVVGEILAGIVLGPSLLSGFFPALGRWVVPHSPVQGHLLELVALLGALFLLLITGLETDLALIRRHARVSSGAALGGIVLPFASGFLLAQWVPDSLLADPGRRLAFSLFFATALSISAIPVIAKVLMDMKLMRRDIGQGIIAAGMANDAVGWVLLSVGIGLASSGEIRLDSLLWAAGEVVGLMLLSLTLGLWLVRRLLDLVQDRATAPTRILTLVMVLTFAWGAVTQALELEAVFGAFVLGILLAQIPRFPASVRDELERIGLGIFAPVFFAVAGLKVNALALLQPRLLGITLLVIAVATLGKVAGGYAGARLIGRTGHWEALSFGAGMNARGAMEIIVASIGLSLGILSRDMFSIIVVMALTTSLITPPALRWTLKRVRPGEEEERRLKREALEEGSLVAGIRRVLLPVRCRPEERRAMLTLESHLLQRLNKRNALAATLLTVTRPDTRAEAAAFLDRLAPRLEGMELSRKVVEEEDATESILDEAQKDYDLLVVGAPEGDESPADLFTSRIDTLLRLAPCPTLVVKGRVSRDNWPPRRILVPVDASVAARNAAEVAFVLAGEHTEVLLMSVVEEVPDPHHPDATGQARHRQLGAAYDLIDELRTVAETRGVRTLTLVRISADPERTLLEMAEREGVDLVILGISLYAASRSVYLGPREERILSRVRSPVLLLNTP